MTIARLLLLFCLCTAAWCARAELLLDGVRGDVADNILVHASLNEEPCDAPRWRIQQRRRDLGKQVNLALQAFGFYQATFTQTFTETAQCWQLNLTVDPGPRVVWRTIDVKLLDPPPALDESVLLLVQQPPLIPGAGLIHKDYDNYKASLLDSVKAQGYWRAAFAQAELAIHPDDLAADAHLHLQLGPRYQFGQFNFSPVPLDQDLLHRLTGDVEGEPYTADALQDIYAQLQASSYFRSVLINPHINQNTTDQIVPMDVDLSMASQTSFGAGVGFSTDQGPRVRGDYQNRYFNEWGHKYRLDALVSRDLQEASGTYTIPRAEAYREWYELSGGWIREDTSSYESTATTARVRAIEAFAGDWILNTGVNLRRESYVIGSEPADEKWLIVPGAGISWVDSETEVRQTYGIRFEAELAGSSQYWLSDVDYLQLRLKGKLIFPLGEKGRLLTRAEVAGTLKDDFSELPPSVRFFTGGDNSVRGYAYQSIGTENDEGEVIGGSHLVVLSAEYDYLFLPNWSASVFIDAGDAFDKAVNYKRGAGIGLRWYSPVGPLRLDIAVPLDREAGDGNYRFHIAVGADL